MLFFECMLSFFSVIDRFGIMNWWSSYYLQMSDPIICNRFECSSLKKIDYRTLNEKFQYLARIVNLILCTVTNHLVEVLHCSLHMYGGRLIRKKNTLTYQEIFQKLQDLFEFSDAGSFRPQPSLSRILTYVIFPYMKTS